MSQHSGWWRGGGIINQLRFSLSLSIFFFDSAYGRNDGGHYELGSRFFYLAPVENQRKKTRRSFQMANSINGAGRFLYKDRLILIRTTTTTLLLVLYIYLYLCWPLRMSRNRGCAEKRP